MIISGKKILFSTFFALTILIVLFLSWSYRTKNDLIKIYQNNQSPIIKDRDGKIILINQNQNNYYSTHLKNIPENFQRAVIQKEDKYFYYHPGVNPFSLARATFSFSQNKKTAASTINQQLAKILLEQEQTRTWRNKFKEILYALTLETWLDKDEVLLMYANTVYFGNNVQGLEMASRLYFDAPPELLSNEQIAALLATIPSPTITNPFEIENKSLAVNSARLAKISFNENNYIFPKKEKMKNSFGKFVRNENYFEIQGINPPSPLYKGGNFTVDLDLTDKLRAIAKRYAEKFINKNGANAAIVVIKPQNNELLAIVGSPDSTIDNYGYKINMATTPRPIGSTVKPFIYLKAMEKGARPYTLVDDREYKYGVQNGFGFYPKNYDFKYRGLVNLEYALDNSLNVPTVKTLEFYGIDNFYNFLEKDLQFKPTQDLKNYELGIALGGLEMDLLSLSYYFSIFPNNGRLLPLRLSQNTGITPLSADFSSNKKIVSPEYVELINKILTNRVIGAEEFSQKSSLNLPHDNYAVKTGTSRDYHDSWTIGYTPDFLVGVWLGNAENKPMDEVSGSVGAGQIWNEAMNLLYASKYNFNTPFQFNNLKQFNNGPSLEYGLENDDYEKAKNIMLDDNLILSPHDGDTFLWEDGMQITLSAREKVEWLINDEKIGEGEKVFWKVEKKGSYVIKGKMGDKVEVVVVKIVE